jgi:uncharacterized protein (TIGR03086 family)
MTQSTGWPVLDTALGMLRSAASSLTPAAYDRLTPCLEWSAAQVLEHAALDQLIWASQVGPAPAPEGDAFAPTGLLEPSPGRFVDSVIDTAALSWSTVAPDRTEVPTPLPQGAMPAATAAAACALDAAIHAWDLQVALGRPAPLTDDLAEQLLPVARGFVEPLRQYGVFAPALASEPTDPPADTLLRYLGRDPRWQA